MGCIRHRQQEREHQPCNLGTDKTCWCEREQRTKMNEAAGCTSCGPVRVAKVYDVWDCLAVLY
eukprot:3331123-Rhodomonas_salina.1